MSSLIELNHITKSYQRGTIRTDALRGINLNIKNSELIAIIGQSGSGKSTLMNIIGLLDRPTTGEYYFNGKDINTYSDTDIARFRNQQIGFVFQAFFLLPGLSVLDNVALPLTYQELSEETIEARALAELSHLGIRHLAYKFPNELSGGQQQRVAIARALVGKPSLILADEPTGALDSRTSEEIMRLFIQLNKVDNNTIIIITHNPLIAEQCSRVIEIEDGLIK